MATIGFIGLGNMGGPMAGNLVKAGHEVKGFDLVPASVKAAEKAGVTAVPSIAEAARDVDVVITMLPAGEHVRQVYMGDGGVFSAARKGTLAIDSSTIDVGSARAVHTASIPRGRRANGSSRRSTVRPAARAAVPPTTRSRCRVAIRSSRRSPPTSSTEAATWSSGATATGAGR